MLHSMMSVLPNGGRRGWRGCWRWRAALDDVSATEWRKVMTEQITMKILAALDDVSATEWRLIPRPVPIVKATSCTR